MKIKILIFGLILVFLLVVFLLVNFMLNYYQNRPVPEYHKTVISEKEICNKIRSDKYKSLCFEMMKNSDFKKNLELFYKITKSSPETFPQYYNTDLYYFEKTYNNNNAYINGIEFVLKESKNNNPKEWCRNFFVSSDGQDNFYYYICRAILENPYYCDKAIDRLSELNGRCFYDVAIINQDSSLCKLSIDPDVCYLSLILLNEKNKGGE